MVWFRPELRVLFVCTANVCRSPLAEGLLRHRLRAIGLAGKVQVRSAGLRAGGGRRPDPRVLDMAAEAGVSLGRIRSRMLTPQMIRRSDYVLVMEQSHLEGVERLCAGLPGADSALPDKVQLLGSYLSLQDGAAVDIPDPYFGDLQSFHYVHEMIDSALISFLMSVRTRFE